MVAPLKPSVLAPRQEILPEFFRNFWVRRMALDRRNYRLLVETTVVVAQKVGCSQIVGRIVEDLKDESEPYRRMVMETIDKVGSGFRLFSACTPSNMAALAPAVLALRVCPLLVLKIVLHFSCRLWNAVPACASLVPLCRCAAFGDECGTRWM